MPKKKSSLEFKMQIIKMGALYPKLLQLFTCWS